MFLFGYSVYGQELIENYKPLKQDSLRIGVGENDFIPFIQSGYTLMLPKEKTVKGVLIFLEDSGFDKKNRNAKQIYSQASKHGFAVLSVSTDIPFDFYFSETSVFTAHQLIKDAFSKHQLPNQNVFFVGASLTGHRALRYIKVIKQSEAKFQLKIKGIVACNFTMDWTRKWYQHKRELKLKRNNLWEATFINYMLETHLKGTPKTAAETYHDFSPYSYTSEDNNNIKYYKDYAFRVYIAPDIKYKLTHQLKTLYENNATDMVGFLAELKLAGNDTSELIVMQPSDNPSKNRNAQSTWNAINKDELMVWIKTQTEDN